MSKKVIVIGAGISGLMAGIYSRKVTGIVCNGSFIPADEVIVTTDTRKALETLFDEPLAEKWVPKIMNQLIPLECMFFGFGVDADLSRYSYSLRIVPKKPFHAAGFCYESIALYNYASIPENAPEGCTTLTAMLYGDSYEWWKSAMEDGSYKQKKQQLIDSMVEIIAESIPETRGNIIVSDMATPLTYEHWCGNWKGSWMSIWPKGTLPRFIPAKCKKTSGLHFAGQRIMLSGGLPIAVRTGRAADLSIRR